MSFASLFLLVNVFGFVQVQYIFKNSSSLLEYLKANNLKI